ncbi:1,25-dihydroxyvitamin D(3) 24-hydroxylase, mitochondrial-like [Glandiceps talaboti]
MASHVCTLEVASRDLLQIYTKQNIRLLSSVRFSTPPSSTNQKTVGKQDIGEIKPFDEVPGPNELKTVFSSILAFVTGSIRKPWPEFAKFRKEYGPMWKQKIGSLALVTLCDPKDLEKVYQNEGKYPMRIPIQPWIQYRNYRGYSCGVVLHEGADWHRHRTVLNKRMMRPKEVASYNDTVNEVVTEMLNKVVRVRQSDNVVPDIENILFTWSLESACAIILNKKMNLLDDKPHPEAQEFIQAVHDLGETTNLLWMSLVPASIQQKLNTWIWKKHVKEWDIVFATAKKLIDGRMDEMTKRLLEKQENDEEDSDFLTYMVSQATLDAGEIYGNVTDLLAVAIDTTSNTTLWALYNLAKHPHVQNLLHEEVCRVVPRGETPTCKHINQMPYLRAVLKESMRLYPVITRNSRILDQDIVIRGYKIPAKTCLVGLTWLIGRDPQLFQDPLEFKPERWLKEEREHFYGTKSIPFGFGPRMCIGKRLAELKIHLALARISQQFSLEATTVVEPMMTVLMLPDRPLNLKFINRVP